MAPRFASQQDYGDDRGGGRHWRHELHHGHDDRHYQEHASHHRIYDVDGSAYGPHHPGDGCYHPAYDFDHGDRCSHRRRPGRWRPDLHYGGDHDDERSGAGRVVELAFGGGDAYDSPSRVEDRQQRGFQRHFPRQQ